MTRVGGRERVGAVLWALCLQFFVAEQVARAAWTLPYDMRRNVISDLGAFLCTASICSPLHDVMNASFVLQGVLIAGGAICLWRRFARWGRVVCGLLVLSGIGVFGVGMVPEDVMHRLHTLSAAAHFVCGGVAMVLLGAATRLRNGKIPGLALVLAGGVALVATGMLLSGGVVRVLGTGLVERFAAYPLPLMLAWTGVRMLVRERSDLQ